MKWFPLLLSATITFTAAVSIQAQNATTDPVGVVQYTINQGFNAVGISMVNPEIAAGRIGSVTTSNLVLQIVSGQNATNFGALLESDKFYYVEITDAVPNSQYEGDRFEVNVAATKAASAGTIVINTSSPRTTISGGIPAELATGNPSFVIRPHVTIAQVFGVGPTAKLTGTNSSATADSITFFENGSFSRVVWYFKSGSNDFWRSGSSNANNEPIPPGVGILVRRPTGDPVVISLSGNVRTNHFAQPLTQGWNFISEPRPVTRSPLQRAMLDSDVFGNWTGTNSSSSADSVTKFVNGSFSDLIWYFKSGTNNSWRRGNNLVNNDDSIFSPTGAVLVRKQVSAPDYYVPNQTPKL